MHEAADDLGEDPDRMSFIRSLRVVRRQVTNQAGFSPHRRDHALRDTINEIQQRHLPTRRNRTYPRVVKRHRSIDRRIKRPHHLQILHNDPPQLHIFAPAA
jgi:hypothetical protein